MLELIDGLDLEPITYRLVHPEPGETDLSIEDADRLVSKYRNFLKLCAMYPEKSIVPSKELDPVWHTHILDTAKYVDDCMNASGFILHHFPYLGLRGPEDEVLLEEKWNETKVLYRLNFGTDIVDEDTSNSDTASAMCNGGCSGDGCGSGCAADVAVNVIRPRLTRA